MEKYNVSLLLQSIVVIILLIFLNNPNYLSVFFAIVAAIIAQVVILLNTINIRSINIKRRNEDTYADITRLRAKMTVDRQSRDLFDRNTVIHQMIQDCSDIYYVYRKYRRPLRGLRVIINNLEEAHVKILDMMKSDDKELDNRYGELEKIHDQLYDELENQIRLFYLQS